MGSIDGWIIGGEGDRVGDFVCSVNRHGWYCKDNGLIAGDDAFAGKVNRAIILTKPYNSIIGKIPANSPSCSVSHVPSPPEYICLPTRQGHPGRSQIVEIGPFSY